MTQAQTISTRKHACSPHPIMAGNRETFDRPKDIEASNCTADPNPAKEWTAFDYTLPENTDEAVIRITDASGQVVKVVEVTGIQGQHVWDTRNIKPGVYYYMFTVDGFSQNGKIVVTH